MRLPGCSGEEARDAKMEIASRLASFRQRRIQSLGRDRSVPIPFLRRIDATAYLGRLAMLVLIIALLRTSAPQPAAPLSSAPTIRVAQSVAD